MSPSGQIVLVKDGEPMPPGYIEANRSLTTREQKRMQINKYSPCCCGSGKKFKFCCFKPA